MTTDPHEPADARPPDPGGASATTAACPACGHHFPWPPAGPCVRCAVDLTSPAATEVFDLDRRWAALAAERVARVRDLVATRPPSPAAPGWAPPAPAGPTGTGVRGVPALLGLAGVALLTAAAVVFTAVAWTTLPPGMKAVVLLAATAAAAVGALRLHARGTTTAAAALGTLTSVLALVDVVGADRAGLVDLGDLAIPLGLIAAAVAGWSLGRVGVGWVSAAGAVAAGLGAFGVTVVVVDAAGLSAPGTTVVGSAAAAVLGATAPTWPTAASRRIAGLLAGSGLAVAGLVVLVAVADGDAALSAGLGALLVPVGAAAAAMLLTPWALAPGVLLVTGGMAAVAVALGAAEFALAAVAAATAAGVAWTAARLDHRWRVPLLLGALPLLAAAAATSVEAAGITAERLGRLPSDAPLGPLDPWAAVSVPLTAVAALAWRLLRRWAASLLALTALVVAGTLPVSGAWVALASLAVAGALADRTLARAPADTAPAALGAALGGMAWAATASWSLALTAAVATAAAAHVVWHGPAAQAAVASGIGTATAGVAVTAALDAVGAGWTVALAGGLGTLLGLTAVLHGWRRRLAAAAGTATAAAATILVPLLADGAAATGMLLLVGAAGWLAVALAGWVPARWAASLVSSAGTTVLLADAGVEVVEAYTVVPAVTLGVVGLLWLRRDPRVRTITALWPALTVAIGPSLVVLARDPRALLRTLLLTGLAGALAVVGVRLRWVAPVLAAAVAAAGVALTQLAVAADVVPRWVTFAVVGVLLVWLAATYEQQQARVRALTGRLLGLR